MTRSICKRPLHCGTTLAAAVLACLLCCLFCQAQNPPPLATQYQRMLDGTLPGILTTDQVRKLAGQGFWQPYQGNPVVACGAEGEFDHAALGTPSVVKVGDIYHLYYETWEKPGAALVVKGKSKFGGRISYDRPTGDYTTLHIGHAISRDGVRWIKDPQNPVIGRGKEGEWDHVGTWDPFVIFEDGIFKMWYGAGVQRTCDWAYAESKDGTHFEKKGRISHLGRVEDCHVVHDRASGKYLMYYWDRAKQPMGLFVAESDGEMRFDFAGARPIRIEGEQYPGQYKFTHVIQENGRWYMFYANFSRPHAGDAVTRLAVSADGYQWKSVNRNLLIGHDAEVILSANGLYLMYYGPLGYFDAMACDIRLAVFAGKLDDLVLQRSRYAEDGSATIARCKVNIEKEMERMKEGAEAGPFRPEWKSLEGHKEAPDWFRDGKIGIYFHWGPYSVPAYGGCLYGHHMHVKMDNAKQSYYQHHVETYGEPDKFGYHDFVPMFKGEKFNAEEWADLFIKSGARWAGPVTEFHDGFSMWKSDLTPWNAYDKGPKRDIVEELAKAIKARGIKFVTTFHHDRTHALFYPRVEGWPTTSSDPVLQFLYMNIDENLFDKIWQTKLGEVIDKYQPDMIWFDGQLQLIPDEYHRYFLSYYFNNAAKWGKDVMVTTKKLQYPQEVSVLDFEQGRASALTPYPWLSDDTMSYGKSWSYVTTLPIKPPEMVIRDFIDMVSKNGQLLLDISPMADGTIPQDQRDCLLEIGKWLGVNGEAIYNTRPWLEYGEGPNRLEKSGSFAGELKYANKDIRYTSSKDGKTLYAIAMGWPEWKFSPCIVQIDKTDGGKVELIGHSGELKYTVDGKRIAIEVPAEKPCSYAYAFKLTGFNVSLTPQAATARDEALNKLMKGTNAKQ